MEIIKTKQFTQDGNDGYYDVSITIFKELGQYRLRVSKVWHGWNADGSIEVEGLPLGTTITEAMNTLHSWSLNNSYDEIDLEWLSFYKEYKRTYDPFKELGDKAKLD